MVSNLRHGSLLPRRASQLSSETGVFALRCVVVNLRLDSGQSPDLETIVCIIPFTHPCGQSTDFRPLQAPRGLLYAAPKRHVVVHTLFPTELVPSAGTEFVKSFTPHRSHHQPRPSGCPIVHAPFYVCLHNSVPFLSVLHRTLFPSETPS